MKTTTILLSIAASTLFSGCEKMMDCMDKHNNCEKSVLLNKVLYDNTSSANYMITDAKISGDCLEVKFGSSGCDAKSWKVELVDAESISESATPQRSLKLALTNSEMCTVALSKSVSFDLTPLRIKAISKINLSLEGLNNQIAYKY